MASMGFEPKLDCGCGCGGAKKSDTVKFKYAAYSALVFFFVANPETYKLVSKLLGDWVAGPAGCPTPAGLFLHTLVFLLLVFGLMKLRS
jgi:hypothetical protein